MFKKKLKTMRQRENFLSKTVFAREHCLIIFTLVSEIIICPTNTNTRNLKKKKNFMRGSDKKYI